MSKLMVMTSWLTGNFNWISCGLLISGLVFKLTASTEPVAVAPVKLDSKIAAQLATDQRRVANFNDDLQYCLQKTVTRYNLRSGKRRCIDRDLEPKQAAYAEKSFQELLQLIQSLDLEERAKLLNELLNELSKKKAAVALLAANSPAVAPTANLNPANLMR